MIPGSDGCRVSGAGNFVKQMPVQFLSA